MMPKPGTDGTILRELTTVVGPMARNVDDLALICDNFFGLFTNDARSKSMWTFFFKNMYNNFSLKIFIFFIILNIIYILIRYSDEISGTNLFRVFAQEEIEDWNSEK